MRVKRFLLAMVITLIMLPCYARASAVLDVQDTIKGFDVHVFPFEANVAPYEYQANLFDLSGTLNGLCPAGAEQIGFDWITFAVIDGSGKVINKNPGFGSFNFAVDEGEKYFAWVVGKAITGSEIGAFGLNIEAVEPNVAHAPIPGAILLLGSGLVGIAGIRKKFSK